MKTQDPDQEARERMALERFIKQTEEAHGWLPDKLGGEDLLEDHGRKHDRTSDGEPSVRYGQEDNKRPLTVILISRHPADAGKTALAFEQPLTLLGSHEELTRAIKSYPYADPVTQLELRQKIYHLVMGPNPTRPPELTPVSFVAFLVYFGANPPIPVRISTQN